MFELEKIELPKNEMSEKIGELSEPVKEEKENVDQTQPLADTLPSIKTQQALETQPAVETLQAW